MTKSGSRLMLAGLLLLGAAPVMADVKAGTDAWHRGDWKAAVEQWRGPAIAGDPDAQFNMGQAYKLGRGVPTDMAQAESWYAKAAAQGHPRAQDNYGLALFQDGRKVDALPWLEKSVARDEPRAELVLGTMLFNGDAVPRDWPRAYALITRSSQQGLAPASQTLAQMDGFLSPDDREQGTHLAARIAGEARAGTVQSPAASPARSTAGVATARVPATRPRAGQGHGQAAPASTATDVPSPGAVGEPPKPAVGKPGTGQTAVDRPAANRPAPQPGRAAPKPAAKAPPAVAASKPPAKTAPGRWRVQLGAFRDPANAKALWARVGGRTGGTPTYVSAGGVTRLQAGPFASKADAARACTASGAACDVLSMP